MLSKSCARAAADGRSGDNRLGESSLADATEGRHENRIKVERTLRKIIRHPKRYRATSDVLHAPNQRVGAERKGFMEGQKSWQPKRNSLPTHCGTEVPKRNRERYQVDAACEKGGRVFPVAGNHEVSARAYERECFPEGIN